MKIKVYFRESSYTPYDDIDFPKVMTEKEYKDTALKIVQRRMKQENLSIEDGFNDWLDCDYTLSKIFFLNQTQKEEILKTFESLALEDAFDELRDYYDEYEIEI